MLDEDNRGCLIPPLLLQIVVEIVLQSLRMMPMGLPVLVSSVESKRHWSSHLLFGFFAYSYACLSFYYLSSWRCDVDEFRLQVRVEI